MVVNKAGRPQSQYILCCSRPAGLFVVSVKGFVPVHHPRPEGLPAIPAKVVQLLVELDILMSRYVVILPASPAFLGFVHGVARFLPTLFSRSHEITPITARLVP